MRRSACFTGWQADHQQAVPGQLGRFAQGMGKGELGFEAACRQVTLVMECARIGHPLVNQDQAGAVFVEQLAQRIARVGGLFIVGLYAVVGFLTAQLPGQLTPQSADDGAICLCDWVTG